MKKSLISGQTININLYCSDPIKMKVSDIAKSLSLQCRFGGSDPPISVATHSAIAFMIAKQMNFTSKIGLAHFLLHDCEEAITGDVIVPTMEIMEELSSGITEKFRTAKSSLRRRMFFGLGLAHDVYFECAAVKPIDLVCLKIEGGMCGYAWTNKGQFSSGQVGQIYKDLGCEFLANCRDIYASVGLGEDSAYLFERCAEEIGLSDQ